MLEEELYKIKLTAVSRKRIIVEDSPSHLIVFSNYVMKVKVNPGGFLLGDDFPFTEVLDLTDTLIREPFR